MFDHYQLRFIWVFRGDTLRVGETGSATG